MYPALAMPCPSAQVKAVAATWDYAAENRRPGGWLPYKKALWSGGKYYRVLDQPGTSNADHCPSAGQQSLRTETAVNGVSKGGRTGSSILPTGAGKHRRNDAYTWAKERAGHLECSDARPFFREESNVLTLSRKTGQRITIGKDVVVYINKCSRGRVTLSIEAPADVKILRAELVPQEPEEPQAERAA